MPRPGTPPVPASRTAAPTPPNAASGGDGGVPASTLHLVDTHAHLNDRRFAGDVDAVMARAAAAGVAAMIVAGYDLTSSRRGIELAAKSPVLWATVGIHPHGAREADARALEQVAVLARRPRVVAIGECGLDFYRNLSPREAQFAAFEAQLALASRMRLPVVIHSRDAMPETLAVLARQPLPAGGVLHCFDGTAADVRRAVDLGMHISVAGPVTHRRDQTLAEAIKAVPASRLVLETDCPWLSPQGHRGERNEPAFIRVVAETVAGLRRVSVAELAAQTSANAAVLFRTPALYQTAAIPARPASAQVVSV